MIDKHFWDFQIFPEKEEPEDRPHEETFITKYIRPKGYLATCLEKEEQHHGKNKK